MSGTVKELWELSEESDERISLVFMRQGMYMFIFC
jgi:hypothetical protein